MGCARHHGHLRRGFALKQHAGKSLIHIGGNFPIMPGWYAWGGEELSTDPGFFSPLHVSHIESYAAHLVPYLALPPGWRVLLAPGQEDAWFDETLLEHEG